MNCESRALSYQLWSPDPETWNLEPNQWKLLEEPWQLLFSYRQAV